LAQDTLAPTDYSSLNYDLGKVPLPTQFTSYYTFSAAYSLQGPLGNSLIQLYSGLANNVALTSAPAASNANAQQTAYMTQYNSGNPAWNAQGTPPAYWNSVTPATWPVFACGIAKMTQSDFQDCVNSY
jgi:hypothetical protein